MIPADQLLTGSDAVVTRQQHTSPCSDCPWARKSLKGWLGMVTPEEWIALAHGEGKADCHATRQPDGSAWDCAGLAIYRANVCKSVRDPGAMRLPPNRVTVFASRNEFLEYHNRRQHQMNHNSDERDTTTDNHALDQDHQYLAGEREHQEQEFPIAYTRADEDELDDEEPEYDPDPNLNLSEGYESGYVESEDEANPPSPPPPDPHPITEEEMPRASTPQAKTAAAAATTATPKSSPLVKKNARKKGKKSAKKVAKKAAQKSTRKSKSVRQSKKH